MSGEHWNQFVDKYCSQAVDRPLDVKVIPLLCGLDWIQIVFLVLELLQEISPILRIRYKHLITQKKLQKD